MAVLKREEFMPVNFLKKEAYTGSHRGMRYRMWKAEEDGETVLMTAAWPEPYGFEATPEEEKVRKHFPFSEEGILAAVEWLNGQYAERFGGE